MRDGTSCRPGSRPGPTSWWHRQLRRRRAGGQDAGVALLMVTMIILIASGLSLLLLASVTNAVRPTLAVRKQVRTLHAAEAGMNVVLSQIRVAKMTDPLDISQQIGDKSQLPCTTTTTPITGQVGGEDGNVTYSVQVRYYRTDPTGQTDAWRSNSTNTIACGVLISEQPKYALIQSVGRGDTPLNASSATSGDRTAEIIYSFKTDNTNATGGAVYLNGKCLDAVTTTPASGAIVALTSCVVGKASQMFAWRSDLTLVPASTLTTTPMCLTADPSGAATDAVRLYPCDGQTHQIWGITDTLYFYIVKGGTEYHACDNGSGNLAVGANCQHTLDIDQGVGSGRAGYPPATVADTSPMQWVNYLKYGRCIDINNWNLNFDVFLWACKQTPDTTELRWNQGFYWDELNATTHESWLYSYRGWVGQDFSSAKSSNASNPSGTPQICLRSEAAGVALRFYFCSASEPRMKWVVNRDTGDYDTSYTIVDNNGNCLDTGPPTATSWGFVTIRAMACTGGESQKWNAPPLFNKAYQKDFQETTGS